MFLPTYDTHECTVDKLDLVLKNLEKILSRKSMIAQVAESRLENCNSLRVENGFLFAHLLSDQSAVSNGSLGGSGCISSVAGRGRSSAAVEDGLSGAAPAELPVKGAPVPPYKSCGGQHILVCRMGL